ncbi:MAG TPA: hypothetical protein VGG06_33125 [Thermoanaerobaculia bacterium]|jgi:hypothetical protein
MKRKLQILGILAVTLIVGVSGAVWASQLGESAPADVVTVEAAVTNAAPDISLEDIFGPMVPSAGECWTGHTPYSGGATLCEQTCYAMSCGFDYWVRSTCTCYCGTMF